MNEYPTGLMAFIDRAGWGDARIEPIPGDASFRRYFRLRRDGDARRQTAMLMHAPPPEENPEPFLNVARWLGDHGMRAPDIYAEDAERGWILTEDFGDDRMREWVDAHPGDEYAAYEAAIDALAQLHQRPAGPFPDYDMATYIREVELLTEWFGPANGLDVDRPGFVSAWQKVLSPMIGRPAEPVTVLRDYHAENIMLLPTAGANEDRCRAQGLIDFQDALVGHPAYDLVSLLQDARREVSPQLESSMLQHYARQVGIDVAAIEGDFGADYARLGAQRNAKIVGIFTRLAKRDRKPKYLAMIPRVWNAMERDLAHPALAPVARWFDDNIPGELRASGGGAIR